MVHVSKAQIKLVRSLQLKKFRDELGLFVAEGEKCVFELAKSFDLEYLIVEDGLTVERSNSVSGLTGAAGHLVASANEISQMSVFKTPQGVIGVFKKKSNSEAVSQSEGRSRSNAVSPLTSEAGQHLILALDGIQDPGNLGTIIRTCDWFGVRHIVCSMDTADCYNPKVVQATMGALARVQVHYVDLPAWLNSQLSVVHCPLSIYGTLLDGKNMYDVLQSNSAAVLQRSGPTGEAGHAVIIMGNEGNGISPEVRTLITHPIRIPSYPADAETSESLNVAIATAIVLAEFRRRE